MTPLARGCDREDGEWVLPESSQNEAGGIRISPGNPIPQPETAMGEKFGRDTASAGNGCRCAYRKMIKMARTTARVPAM
jgi:hypothetical protein